VTANAIIGSSIFVGFVPGNPTAPLLGGTFASDESLGSVSTKSRSNSFVNSVVVAPQIRSVKLSSVETNNSGNEFGVLGNQSISSVTVKSPPFKWDKNGAPDQSLDDFHVILP